VGKKLKKMEKTAKVKMCDFIIIRKEEFPEWLKESEFYLEYGEGEFEVEKWLLLDEPKFDTVKNIMHFLRIVDYIEYENINIEPYIPKLKDFIKNKVNYSSLIYLLSCKNYGIYKRLLKELEK
jgi:hypothetical protein